MKKHIASFSILFALLGLFASGHISSMIYAENTSSTVEYMVEERVAEKDITVELDDNSMSVLNMIAFNTFQKTMITSFKHDPYNFELEKTLFRPPISL